MAFAFEFVTVWQNPLFSTATNNIDLRRRMRGPLVGGITTHSGY